MPRWVWVLLPVGVAAFILSFFHVSEVLLFALSIVGLIPLAAAIGIATEDLAYRIGAAAGGLVNATLGNVPELVIGVLALHAGLLTLVKATIVGSVIGNASLVVGMAVFYGGLKNGIQRFDEDKVGHHAMLMVMAVASLALPSLFNFRAPAANSQGLSLFVAFLLIVIYVAYILYDIADFRGGGVHQESDTPMGESEDAMEELVEAEGGPQWSWRQSVVILAVATLAVTLVGDVLVNSIKPATQSLGISQFFVGIVLVPIVANIAEHFSAVTLAGKGKMDLSFAVASGSAIQVAIFVAPVLVIVSFLWHPMSLVFNPIAIAVLALNVAIFFFVAQGGRSNWLQGLQLMILYVMAAAVFFYLPISKAI